MLKVKKISGAIFPRDFSIALNSFCYKIRPSIDIKNEQIKQIKKLQNKVAKDRKSKEVIKLETLFKNDPYSFANEYNIKFELNKSEIKQIKNQISNTFFKSKEDKNKINRIIQEKELTIISEEYNKIHK